MSRITQRDLRMEAAKGLGGACPLCRVGMTRESRVTGVSHEATMRTRGHDLPQHRGGLYWVHICRQCNTDQRERTFREWGAVLKFGYDPRADAAYALAALFERYVNSSGIAHPPRRTPSEPS